MEIPTTPGTRTVANDEPTLDLPPTDCPISGNTYRNTNTSRNGWIMVRITNSTRCLRSTVRSRSSRA